MPGRPQLDDAIVGADVRQVVAGVREDDPARRGLEDREQAGDEHPGRHLGRQQLVRPGEDLARLDQPRLPPRAGSSGSGP